jgi:hypothetical protein
LPFGNLADVADASAPPDVAPRAPPDVVPRVLPAVLPAVLLRAPPAVLRPPYSVVPPGAGVPGAEERVPMASSNDGGWPPGAPPRMLRRWGPLGPP